MSVTPAHWTAKKEKKKARKIDNRLMPTGMLNWTPVNVSVESDFQVGKRRGDSKLDTRAQGHSTLRRSSTGILDLGVAKSISVLSSAQHRHESRAMLDASAERLLSKKSSKLVLVERVAMTVTFLRFAESLPPDRLTYP